MAAGSDSSPRRVVRVGHGAHPRLGGAVAGGPELNVTAMCQIRTVKNCAREDVNPCHSAPKKAMIGRLLDSNGDLVGIFRLIRI